jgi:hypothetical protein
MPTLADNRFAVRNDAADARIRLRREQPAFGQAQCACHMGVIGGGEVGRHAGDFALVL